MILALPPFAVNANIISNGIRKGGDPLILMLKK
jgi:hypothetical protein